ncbi:phosphotransferase family protein [Magnetospira thiophila]
MTAPTAEEWPRLLDALRAAGFSPPVAFLEARRLGGGEHNPVFGLRWDRRRVVVRLPDAGRSRRIDRQQELANAQAAARLSVGPKVLYGSAQDGTLVMPWIVGRVPSEEDFRDPGLIDRAAQVLRRLHRSSLVFRGEQPPLAFVDRQQDRMQRNGLAYPEDLRSQDPAFSHMRSWLTAHPGRPAPCHLDPIAANTVDTGRRVLLLDWEYAAVSDPIWDLANLGARNDFTAEDDDRLLAAYGRNDPQPDLWQRYLFYKTLCARNWALVYVIEESRGFQADGPRHKSSWWIKTVRRSLERARALGFLK